MKKIEYRFKGSRGCCMYCPRRNSFIRQKPFNQTRLYVKRDSTKEVKQYEMEEQLGAYEDEVQEQ